MSEASQRRELAVKEMTLARERCETRDLALADPEYLSAAWNLVALNTGLIHFVLKRRKWDTADALYDDAAQWSCLAMFNACWTYDPRRGKFSTHAYSAVFHQLTSFRHNEERLALPYSVPLNLTRGEIKRRRAAMPGEAEKARLEERHYDEYKRAETLARAQMAYDTRRVWLWRRSAGENGEQQTYEGDALEQAMNRELSPFDDPAADAAVGEIHHEAIANLLATMLDDRERQILTARFALDGGDPLTLEQCAKIHGVTRERIRQIQMKALRRLKVFFDPGFDERWVPETFLDEVNIL